MRRLLVLALLALSAAGSGGTAQAFCVGNLACAVNGCYGTVNACPTAEYCSGGVSVCPMAHPRNCTSAVDVCLDLVGPVLDCGPVLAPVCKLLPS
ncbi:MAG TPA: hypothetical protein VNA20_01150 [Frankiaceae bacterium]|nr:hypothetical protein [Frankiaceae bacterium]